MYFFNIITVMINFVPFKTNHWFLPPKVCVYGKCYLLSGFYKTPNITDCEYLLDWQYILKSLPPTITAATTKHTHALHITDVSLSSFLLSFLVSHHLSHSADCRTHRYRRNYPRVRRPSTAKEQRLTIKQDSADHCVRAPCRKDTGGENVTFGQQKF